MSITRSPIAADFVLHELDDCNTEQDQDQPEMPEEPGTGEIIGDAVNSTYEAEEMKKALKETLDASFDDVEQTDFLTQTYDFSEDLKNCFGQSG